MFNKNNKKVKQNKSFYKVFESSSILLKICMFFDSVLDVINCVNLPNKSNS